MISLFEKIETIQINNTSLLDAEDKAYCEILFNKYKVHAAFWWDQLQEMQQAYTIYKQQQKATEKDFYYALCPADKIFDNWTELIKKLTTTLIQRIETHFKEKYHVEFESFSPITAEDSIQPIISYEAITESMITQVGTDLQQSGKDLIKKEFMNLFRYERSQPELIGKKIAFPCFSYLETSYANGSYHLSYNDKRLQNLLHAANLFFSDTTELTTLQRERFNEWRNEVKLNVVYNVGNFSLKFYKNARVDVSFENAAKASQFMSLYQLEHVTRNWFK